jgi:hypothetical protein
MGGKSKAPAPPNYAPIAQASSEAAKLSYQASQEQLAWARETYALDSARQDRNEATTNELIQKAITRQDAIDSQAAKDRARYEQVFQPLEDNLVKEAEGYTDERNRARADAAGGRAAADVSANFLQARAAAQDRLESYGIDPSQIRGGALDLSARLQEATARAGSSNMMRDNTQRAEEATGRALRTEALNIGRGYPGQVAQSYGLAMQQGTGAANMGFGNVNAGLATTASGAQTMGTGVQWQGAGNSALGTWGNVLNAGYGNRIAGYKAQNEASSGFGQAVGLGLGLMSTPMKGTGFGALAGLFEEGGVVPHPDGDGAMIPPEASPTGGRAIDDIPARLNAGEFVVPADVVRWKGEEFFQRTIQGSRKKREEAPAKPRVQAVPLQRPAIDLTTAAAMG